MARILRNCLLLLVVSQAVGAVQSPWTPTASACPGCKNANETESLRPRAYMYSILFMLAMPATVFTGFGIAFYRLSRRAELEHQMLVDAGNEDAAPEES